MTFTGAYEHRIHKAIDAYGDPITAISRNAVMQSGLVVFQEVAKLILVDPPEIKAPTSGIVLPTEEEVRKYGNIRHDQERGRLEFIDIFGPGEALDLDGISREIAMFGLEALKNSRQANIQMTDELLVEEQEAINRGVEQAANPIENEPEASGSYGMYL